jgi:hypothetical protein
MPNAKFIPAAVWDALPEIDVTAGEDLFPQLDAGTYRPVLSSVAPFTVAALTAGSIVQADPQIGDELTVTGSNATGSATFQWQQSADGSTGWADISGATSATLDTSSGVTGDNFVRRGVSDGAQGPVYTAAVQVAALPAAAYAERIVTTGGQPTFYSAATASVFTAEIDVSGYTAGQNLIVFSGPGQVTTGLTVNGNSAGAAVAAVNPGTNRRITVFEYTLQAADIAAGLIDVVATLAAANNSHEMDMFVTDGSVADTATSNHGPDALSIAVTPTQAANAIIHVAMGWTDSFAGAGGIVYTGGITAREYNYVGPRFGAAAGIVLDAPISEQTITWTDTETSGPQYATIALVVE